MAQTHTILSQTQYGTPSGNYDGSSQDWASDPVQAADYYKNRGASTQTIAVNLQGFQGRIVIQASLDTEPDQAAWFDVYEYESVGPATDYPRQTVVGNFVWLRARVELFEAGTIDFITVTY